MFCTLGSGFFGDVFKVRSKEDGKLYAIKKSRERFKGSSDRKQKLQEVAKHEHLPEHPNLVRFYKAWEEHQRLYIQIELCECSLSMFADLNHDIPEKEVWNFLIDMLQAVNHLHSNQYLHLDIKPENIFISRDGIYKLGDFGLVVDLRKKSSIDPLEGDPKYLAKETIQGIFTESADIFSLGITTLELACDLDLPSGGDIWHLLRSNNNIPDSCFKNISPELKYIIKKMMNSDYLKRPSASELLNYPIIKKLRKKRNLINKMRTIYNLTIDYLISFFLLLMNMLFIFKLIDYVKLCFYKTELNVSSTPIFKKDSSLSHLSMMQSPLINMYSVRKERTLNNNNENELVSSALDASFNLNNNIKNLKYNHKLQDSTVNSSAANPNQSEILTNNATNSDITPPMYSFNHYIKDNADLQSTTHRSLKNKNHSFFNNNVASAAAISFSNGCETPVKKGMFSNKQDESPTSIYFGTSFNQSNRLDFSEDEDDDLMNASKLNLSHNQTQVGQKNLLRVSVRPFFFIFQNLILSLSCPLFEI